MKRILFLVLLLSGNCFGAAIAQWKMNDDTDSNSVVDSVGSHTGVFYDENDPATVTSDHATTGQINGGLDFDGTNDYITVADHDDFSPVGTPFSIAAWISLDADEGAAGFYILNKMNVNKYEWDFKVSGDALIFILLDWRNNSSQIGRKDTADYSLWEGSGFIFVVATYDGGIACSGIKLYLNGEQCDDSDESNNPNDFVEIYNEDEILRIGVDFEDTVSKGVIDNVVVYNTVLTQTQITALYNGGAGTEGTGLISNRRVRYSDGYRYTYRSRYN